MTTQVALGKLTRVDLRACWEREDSDFTPWLASEENIALLGEAIGMELEVQQEEAAVGPFRADILCRDTASDKMVVIENQLDVTDHTHLGQILTYAAGLDAVTVVWIAKRFTEEHRAALDWLNRISHEDIRFFGVEIELWRIGDSPPAPKFNIVAKPNDWSRTVRETAAARTNLSETNKVRVEFWRQFGAFLENKGAKFKPPKPYPSNWMQWGLGRTGVGLLVVANLKEVLVGVDVDNVRHPTWFRELASERQAIEEGLGFTLEWNEKPGNKFSTLRCRQDADLKDTDTWADSFAWILDRMKAIDKVFRPRIKALDDSPLPELVEA